MNKKETLGSVIQNLRKEKNITQKELAKILHVSDKSISRWETDVNYPDLEILFAISAYFNVPIKKLVELRVSNSNPGVIITDGKIKYGYFIYPILILIILVLIVLLIMSKGKATKIYTIYGEDEYVYITSGFYIDTDKQDILVLGDINFKEDVSYEDIVIEVLVSQDSYTFTRLDNIYLYLDEMDIDDLYVNIIIDGDVEYSIKLEYSENIVSNVEDSVVVSFDVGEYSQEDIIEMLEENGFTYVNANTLSGDIGEYDVVYYKALNTIQLNFNIDNSVYKIKYYFNDNILNATITYNSLNIVKNYNYYLISDYLECNIGVCEYSEIESMIYILNEVIFSKIN